MSYVAATDWNEVTAIATALLAVLTFLLVIAALFAARYARRDIEAQLQTSAEDLKATRDATEAAQAAVQRQIEASRLPLLIDVTETTSVDSDLDPRKLVALSFPGGHEVEEWDWRRVYVGYPARCVCVAVPLRNVGSGLAVIDVKGIRVIGDGLDREILGREVHRERVPPGETTRILCTHGVVPSAERRDLHLLVPYRDFADEQPTVADVRLERVQGDQWRVRSVMPVAPENISL
jgi:hypothetical protein